LSPADSSAPDISVSFEFFPPKSPEMEASLWRAIERLAPLRPAFVSVTYGAGGTTRERTHTTVRRLRAETDLEPAAHLTCVGATRAEIDGVARSYQAVGVRHLVALRGDPPAGVETYEPHPDGYPYAVDLVAGLARIGGFEISVAAYPETHPAAASPDADLDNLKRKIDAGATRAITNFFFEAATYERFLERVRRAGITVPIVPGLMPISNFGQICKFSAACGIAVPQALHRVFDGLDGDPETRRLVAASVAAEQVMALRALGCREFHFYTLNRAELVLALCHRLGIKPQPSAVAA
jgi:methylenetetrahydrofolate reductase (NADPH)